MKQDLEQITEVAIFQEFNIEFWFKLKMKRGENAFKNSMSKGVASPNTARQYKTFNCKVRQMCFLLYNAEIHHALHFDGKSSC